MGPSVLPGPLGFVYRFVGAPAHLGCARDRTRSAYTDRDRYRESETANTHHQSLAEQLSFRNVCSRDDHHELIVTEPRDEVLSAHDAAKCVGHFAQRFVS